VSGRWTLHHGDCLAWLRTLPSESVDSIVTDPPAGIGFMGAAWDHHKGGRAQWVAWLASVMCECLRVLKPGGHALVWSLPRTEHWTACAVEDAGFEIRDGVYHLCAQGWPKSLDVSKAIDAAAGAEREVVGRKVYGDGHEQNSAESVGFHGNDPARDVRSVTAPATDDAKRWQGWGTALKPAVERWVLARKPLVGTVAANVLAHGTGALNVDGCRVEASDSTERVNTASVGYGGCAEREYRTGSPLGRWPANVVLSHAETCGDECDPACPVRELDARTSTLRGDVPAKSQRVSRGGTGVTYSPRKQREMPPPYTDEGGASRFFPVFHPFGYFGKAKSKGQRGGENRHPTVKHLDLMRWLVRLVTPRGGLVLDAFGGSGTTGCAALLEGMRFAGAEQDAEHYALACKRLAAAEVGGTVVRTVEPAPKPAGRPVVQPSLFGTEGER
jgi:site-specific DNA-methyltransferase (adenine-specific)